MLRARYQRITFFFARMLLQLAYWEILLPKLGLRNYTLNTRANRLTNSAQQFRAMAISMGGVMIKIGQFLSARVDILPPEFTRELEGLQDEVSPEKFEKIKLVAEQEFGAPIETIFDRIEEEPVAAASIGQAHLAWVKIPATQEQQNLPTQEDQVIGEQKSEGPSIPSDQYVQVIVKIQRTNIESIVQTDLNALRRVGKWLQWYEPIRRRADISALLDEFSNSLYQEMDYIQEGENAEKFAENFSDRPRIRVPRVAWRFTTRRVITLEDVTGIKITDYDQITAVGINPSDVATLLFQTYMEQIFVDLFFHADPHPGNLFVLPGKEIGTLGTDWQLVFVDFGMMGTVTPEQRAGLREMAIAITTQDASRAVKAYKMMGFLLPDANLSLIEQAGTEVFERFWGKSTQELRDINIQEIMEFTSEYRDLMYDLPFQVPNDLLLLGRALSILSGMCAGLDPEFNVWLTMLPIAQELISEERATGWDYWQTELSNLQKNLVRLPGRINNILVQIENGDLNTRNTQLNTRVDRIEKSIKFLGLAILSTSMMLSGVIFYVQNYHTVGIILLIGSALFLIWSLIVRN